MASDPPQEVAFQGFGLIRIPPDSLLRLEAFGLNSSIRGFVPVNLVRPAAIPRLTARYEAPFTCPETSIG